MIDNWVYISNAVLLAVAVKKFKSWQIAKWYKSLRWKPQIVAMDTWVRLQKQLNKF